MRRLHLLLLGILSFCTTLGVDFFRAAIAVALCGSLSFSSLTCNGYLTTVESMYTAKAATDFSLSGQEIAIPPIIREAPIDLQGALADDFVVARQTPYSSGRNEVLIVSPSTGTEQRFEISLPTVSSFRFYEASFAKVTIDDPSRVISGEGSLSPTQVQAMLESFTINFDSNNLASKVTLADGSQAEFSESEAVIRSADGQVIERVSLSSNALLESRDVAFVKDLGGAIAQASPGCEGSIRDQIYTSGRDAGSKSNVLRNAKSDEGKAFAWAMTFGKRALEDSLVATSRNQTLQEVACKPPVQCNQPQRYEGGSEIRTDLFQLPSCANSIASLEYEFYTIPDRLELYNEGQIVFSVGPAPGTGKKAIENLPRGAQYLGVKLIGNENEDTRWWYTISCSPNVSEEETTELRIENGPDTYVAGYSPCNSQKRSAPSHRRLLSQNYSNTVGQSMSINRVRPQGLIDTLTVDSVSRGNDLSEVNIPTYYDDFRITVEMPDDFTERDLFKDMQRGLDVAGRGAGCSDFRDLGSFSLWRRANGSNGYGSTSPVGDSICGADPEEVFSSSQTANIGDIYSIDIFGPDNGNVMVTDLYESEVASYFRYTTLYGGSAIRNLDFDRRGHHPNRGAREYGFEKNSDRSVTFYVRGVDQWYSDTASFGNDVYSGIFEGENEFVTAQQKFWLSFLRGIGARVEDLGGCVLIEADFNEHIEVGLPNCFESGGYPFLERTTIP